MDILEISNQPTVISIHCDGDVSRYHESVLRSYLILDKVKVWLELGTPASVILEGIAVMEQIKHPNNEELQVHIETMADRLNLIKSVYGPTSQMDAERAAHANDESAEAKE